VPDPSADQPRHPRSAADGLTLDGPQLELDELLSQLLDRAHEVRAAHGRLRGLLRANTMITSDLALPVVLRSIVEAACELVYARYGALGVIAPGGGLEQFIHVGMDDDAVARIGHLPEGKGLLGALIEDPHPIRLSSIAEDHRSAGFPPFHPPMDTFLGVPVRVRGEIYGNLYLTGRQDGEFTFEDQELVTALAVTAGVAIENARLFDEARRRQNWLQASTDITRQLLSSQGEEPLRLTARRTREIADADLVTLVLPSADGERLMVEVATGTGAAQMQALSYPMEGTLSAEVLRTGQPVLIADMEGQSAGIIHLSEVMEVGALMGLPLVGTHRVRGVLLVARLRGRPRFTDADLEMATTFANHAAVALELADARADQQRMVLLEDRDRIARDLHDHVIQRLFACGLSIESIASAMPTGPGADRLSQIVGELDETIRRIRSSIFQLRGSAAPATSDARMKLLEVAAEAAETLGFEPEVSFAGPVDAMTNDEITDDLLATLREALANVARHAHAGQVAVAVTATPLQLSMEVVDDGVGLAASTRRSGLANLRHRAEARGGTMALFSPWPESADGTATGGTRLLWTIPLA
jgi:signal transduction histidine kinase